MKIFLIISLLYSPFFYLSAQERIIISDKFNAVENYYTTKGNEFLVTRNSAEVKLKEVMDESGNSFYILTDEFIVALNDNYSENDLILLLSHKNCAVLKKYKYLNHYKIKSSSNNFSEIYNYLNSSSIIKYVDPIFALADISVLGGSNSDPYLDYQYYLNNMKILDVWNENVLGENVIIAVMDEGIQPEHEDLHANIFINYSELNGTPGIDDDDNGYIDDINGWNSISNNGDVYPSTDPEHPTLYQNHGMNVAGIIAAGINNLGIIGVAPLSKILPIKFYDRYIPNNSSQGINLFYTDVFIDAMEYILTIREQFNKRIVISFSLGWYPSVQPASIINILELSVSEPFYIPFFAAPGNNGNHPILFPASLPTTFSVARTGSSDNWINNSNPAGFENDFAAPGYNITTTDDIHRSGYTFNWSGTSASTPMAAGIAALLLSVKNDLSVEQLSTILKNSADKVGGVNYYWNPQMPGHSIELGYGRLNAFRAYRSIVNMEFINDVEGISMGQLKVNGQTINSGYNEVFISGSNVQAEIVSNIYSNGIHNTKFYRWNFNDINGQRRNHLHNFIVNPEENQLISSYKRTKQITVRNYFEGGNGHTILFGEKNFDVTSRTSPHLENAFIYQPQVVEATYHATAEPTHTNHLGTNWYFQNWENGSTSLAREEQITQSSSSEWRANYKGIQRSDQWSTYTNNNQRKLIRGDNGVLYNVYESINKVWLEKSTNNGVSWQIANKGKPLSNIVSKNPSMCNYGGIPIIVLEEEGYINIYKYEPTIDSAISKLRFDSGNTNFSATPVIGYSFSQFSLSKIMVIWKINDIYWYEPGLYFILIDTDPFNWTKPNEVMISNTNLYSLNPSIDTYISTSGYPRYYHLAWEQEGTIRYCKLVEDASGNIAQTNHSVISNGSSYIFHSSPSIIAIGTGARVCWLGWNDTDPIVSAVVFRDPANSRFWSFGSNVSKPNINKSNDNTYYAFGWSQNNSTVKFADNSLRSVYEIIGITGKDVQISNGNGKTNMFANIFKAASQPYFFTMSNNLNHYYSIQKSNGMLVSSGRTGVIRKNGGEVYFALGDIAVNNQKVEFVECSPETDISNTSQLNQYLETEPFEVTDNSGFEYTVQYGTVDTSLASGMFSQGEQVRFKVELIDNNSGELLGVFDDVVYDQNNLADFENILYQVNTQGIGQRTVKLRLRIEENINPVVSMVDRIDNEGALTKGKRKELKYEGETIPKEFALEQNYPNPFNPSTKISWQSPVGSHTTLKVYDILGNEIATLVDEYRAAGKHKVEFDASALASGVYIYKLTAGSFISSKKMMVIK